MENFVILHRKQNKDILKEINFLLCIALCLAMATQSAKAKGKMKEVMSDKQKAIMMLSVFEASGNLPRLETAIHESLDRGVTVNEVKEVFSHLYAYTGFPRSLNALGTLQKVLEARKKEGKTSIEGKEATSMSKDFDALKEGARVQTRLGGGQPFDYRFCPAEDYYLKAHLFGDIFARDVLTFAERELATICALSAIEGLAPQLEAHVKGARNMGMTDEEIKAIPSILAAQGNEKEAYRTKRAVAKAFGEKMKEEILSSGMPFPKGDPNTAYAKHFTGNSYLAPLVGGSVPLTSVTFEPGCRNNWHVHHDVRQVLICVGGEGWYQEWGKPAQRLKVGDVVEIPVGVKHWHGATKNSWFQHIALHINEGNAPSNEWLEAVSDKQYEGLDAKDE